MMIRESLPMLPNPMAFRVLLPIIRNLVRKEIFRMVKKIFFFFLKKIYIYICIYLNFCNYSFVAAMSLGAYARDGVSIEPNQDIIPQSPVLRKPVPMYPVNMQQSHVTNEITPAACSRHTSEQVSVI